jgi:hypothetical protein
MVVQTHKAITHTPMWANTCTSFQAIILTLLTLVVVQTGVLCTCTTTVMEKLLTATGFGSTNTFWRILDWWIATMRLNLGAGRLAILLRPTLMELRMLLVEMLTQTYPCIRTRLHSTRQLPSTYVSVGAPLLFINRMLYKK